LFCVFQIRVKMKDGFVLLRNRRVVAKRYT